MIALYLDETSVEVGSQLCQRKSNNESYEYQNDDKNFDKRQPLHNNNGRKIFRTTPSIYYTTFFYFKFADQFVTKRNKRGCQRLVTSAELYDTKHRVVAAYWIAFCYEIE